jgi:acetyl-CoA carboxylase carboxyltransferase component
VSTLETTSPTLRRIEAPTLVDRRGTVWAPGLIDVTLRYRDRPVLVESPPPGISAEMARSLREAAARFAGARGAAGAFTVSFLADLATGEHRFLGTRPGLPEGAAVIEARDETDLAAIELHLSRGGTLDAQPPEARGYALQVCLSARDPEDGFTPSPGIVEDLRLPTGPGLRADPAVEEGDTPADGEEIARVTAHGRTRAEALARLQRGLARTEIAVRDGATDKAFLAEVLDRPELINGDAPGWIDGLVASGEHLPKRGSEAALLAAAIAGYEEEIGASRVRFYASSARGRTEMPKEAGSPAPLRYRGQTYLLRVRRLDWRLFRVEIDGLRLHVIAEPPGRTGRRLLCGDRSWRAALAVQGNRLLVEIDGIPHRIERGEAFGDSTQEAPRRVRFQSLIPPEDAPASPHRECLEEVRRLMLGYDADPETVQRLLTCALSGAAEADPRLEEEILQAFVDVGSLFRRRPEEGAEGAGRRSAEEYFFTYLRDLDSRGDGLPPGFVDKLRRALAHYGVGSLDRSAELEESLFRIAISQRRMAEQAAPILVLLEGWQEQAGSPELRDLLDRVIAETQGREPAVHDLAREVRYRGFDRLVLLAARERIYADAEADLAALAARVEPEEYDRRIRSLVECPQPLHQILSGRFQGAGSLLPPEALLEQSLLEIMVRRYYRIRELSSLSFVTLEGQVFAIAGYDHRGSHVHLIATHAGYERLAGSLEAVRRLAAEAPASSEIVADLYFWRPGPAGDEDAVAGEVAALLESPGLPSGLRRVAAVLFGPEGSQSFTFRRSEAEGDAFREDRIYRGIHPMLALRLELWRLQNFHLERLPAPDGIYFFHGVAHENPRDERLFAVAEVRDLTPVRDGAGRVVQLPQLEYMLMEALACIRRFQSRRAPGERLQWNRVLLNVWPPVDLRPDELSGIVRRLAPLSEGLGLEKVAVRCRIPDREGGELRDWVLQISNFEEAGTVLRFRKPAATPLKPLREYAQKVVELRRRGLPYPYEVVKRLAPSQREAQLDLPAGQFVEHDLAEHDQDGQGRLVPVDRPYGSNTANVVAGVIRNFTDRYPEGMTRVILLGDPSRGLGALAEPECRRIVAALDLAREMGVPLEWFTLSAGAEIEANGEPTDGIDWTGLVLRRLVEFTQAGGEVNVVATGAGTGTQPFWNAVATMLTHTRGVLIGASEEAVDSTDGQAQHSARDLGEACRILLRHYDHTWVAPGERFPRSASTRDPRDRDVRDVLQSGKPSEIRHLMAAVVDQDQPPLERWYAMRDAEMAVAWDAHLGGHPVCLLGFEPDTLPPLALKKMARAIEAASGNRPLVVLANLSGLDGSVEGSVDYGAEIARAVVGFQGPIVFCVISRGVSPGPTGASVFFSKALHDNMAVVALDEIALETLRPYLIAAVEKGM